MHDHPGGQPEKTVEPAHPFAVAARQVIVDGNDVHALVFERVEIGRKRCDKRLAFTGPHFGDGPFVEHHAADKLYVEVPHAKRALGAFAHRCKGGNQHVGQLGAIAQLLPELLGLGPELLVGELFELGLEGVDGIDIGLIAFDAPIVGRAEKLPGERCKSHEELSLEPCWMHPMRRLRRPGIALHEWKGGRPGRCRKERGKLRQEM